VSKLVTVWSIRAGFCARCATGIKLGGFMIAAGSVAFLKASLSVLASCWADSANPYWFGPRWHWFMDFSNALTLYRLPFWSTFTRSIPSVLARFPRRPWAVSWSAPTPLANWDLPKFWILPLFWAYREYVLVSYLTQNKKDFYLLHKWEMEMWLSNHNRTEHCCYGYWKATYIAQGRVDFDVLQQLRLHFAHLHLVEELLL